MASALEQFVVSVRTISNVKELCDIVTKASDVLLKNVPHLDNVLETLDVQQHSLGVLAVLIAKFSNSTVTLPDNRFLLAQEFILNCNVDQVKSAPHLFSEFCHLFSKYLIEQKTPIKGINLLKHAIISLKYLQENQLSSIHADLCMLCLHAKCFKPALQILDVDIVSICQELSQSANGPQFDAKYFLLYYYYGGQIYLALRNLERALYFFEVALTTPSHAVSHIMIEAYKKYVLVSLLLHGRMQQIPKYSSKVVARFIKPLSQAYIDLGNEFVSNDSVELGNVISKHAEAYTRDRNMGLVKQVALVLYKKNIQRLTKTFLTLSLSDVASRVGLPGPEDAEKHILNMIENGQIYATINQKDGMVVFSDEPDKYCGSQVLKTIEDELALCMEFNNRILAMDEEIQVNPQYVKKLTGGQEEEQPSKNAYVM